jgi:hypothetical protein
MKQGSIKKMRCIRCGRNAVVVAAAATLAISALFPGNMAAASASSTDSAQDATFQQQPEADSGSSHNRPSIVGLWSVSLHSGGKVIDQAIYQWHSEHLVITNDDGAPQPPNSVGSVCLGVWKQIGHRTYKVRHPTWSFDATGTENGTILLLEEVTLDADGNSYHGRFIYDVFDLNKKLVSETTGVAMAKRIEVD